MSDPRDRERELEEALDRMDSLIREHGAFIFASPDRVDNTEKILAARARIVALFREVKREAKREVLLETMQTKTLGAIP